jgi:3'(2'), 5'-bisphosphate nucleotidase
MTQKIHAYLEELLPVAMKASHAIMEVYESGFDTEWKEDNSPVTEADIKAHHIIDAALRRITPQIPVISEEGKHPLLEDDQSFWLVDPLDGTKSFIRRDGQFTVNIALIEKRRPTFAIMTVPAQKLYYAGAIGQGAFRKYEQDTRWQPITTSAVPQQGYRVVASKSHSSDKLAAWLKRIDVQAHVPAGSALKFVMVAQGDADIYPRLGPTMEWDTAAGQCILEAAGGVMTDLQGNPFRYNKSDYRNGGFIATGKEFTKL